MRAPLSTSVPFPISSRVVAGFLAATALGGCAGALEDADRFDYLFSDAGTSPVVDAGAGVPVIDAGMASTSDGGCDPVVMIFPTTCATAACHSTATHQSGLDLESPGLPARLVNEAATTCAGDIINASDPDSSVLYTQVTPTPPDQFRMPLGMTPLSDDQIACLKSWVEAAAAQ